MVIAIDTNVLSALWSDEPDATAIRIQLLQARNQGQLILCPVVYVELAAYPRMDMNLINGFLNETDIQVTFDMPNVVWHNAATRYSSYANRRRSSKGGHSKRLPADFLIGAHALLCADVFFTLEHSRYQRDFPELSMM